MTATASTASPKDEASIYDTFWPQYRAAGLYTVPIGPSSKAPHIFTGSMTNGVPNYVLLAAWTQRAQITSPQPGAGIGLLCGRSDDPNWMIVAIDFDNEDIALQLYDQLPDAPTGKIGQRGDTRFYKARHGAVASRKFKINKKSVVEILSAGTQTVLPPTEHPDIKRPYRWSSANTLLQDWRSLPELPSNVVEIIEDVLTPLGYAQEPEKAAAEEGSPYKDFNRYCQARIDMWVPDLGLPKLTRSGRRFFIYKAVAFWRDSTQGRELKNRDPNLKISRKVIYDHGNDQAYSPLDLVMAARNATLQEAWAWLDEKVGWSKRGPDIDWNGLGVDENDEEEEPEKKTTASGGGPQVLSSAAFTDGFDPPDYLLDGLMQRRFLYSYTAMTGGGKTASALYIAYVTGTGGQFGPHEAEQGAVCYLAGENPDDVRMRWMAMSENLGFDLNTIDVHFVPGRYNIKDVKEAVEAKAKELGKEFALIIVDTSAAYFPGNDENSNAQAGAHARDLRSLIDLPGGPTVLVTCHPTKSPDMENLLPRGGGAYVAEVDGNLVGIKRSDTVTEIHWHGKYRGVDFEPIPFELKRVTAEGLKDSKGRKIPSVMAVPLTESDYAKAKAQARGDEDAILRILRDDQDGALSYSDVATRAGWLAADGRPQRRRARTAIERLMKAGLVHRPRGDLRLSKKGRKAADVL